MNFHLCACLLVQFSAEDEKRLKRMQDIGIEVTQAEKKLSDIIYEIDGIHRVGKTALLC